MGWPEIIDAVKGAVVRVRSGGVAGTAFHVEGGILVSAHHVISSPTQVDLHLPTGAKATARLATNPALASVDLAVLTPETPQSIPTLALGNVAEARVGEEVLFAGYPLDAGMPLTFHRAMIAFTGSRSFPPLINREVDCLQLDGSINLGNSGGPVVNDRGAVIGVVNARYGKLTTFLDEFLKDQSESREMLTRTGGSGRASAGVLQIGDKTYKQFDTRDAQNAFIDIVSMFQRHMNVGIGWAISSEYIRRHALR